MDIRNFKEETHIPNPLIIWSIYHHLLHGPKATYVKFEVEMLVGDPNLHMCPLNYSDLCPFQIQSLTPLQLRHDCPSSQLPTPPK